MPVDPLDRTAAPLSPSDLLDTTKSGTTPAGGASSVSDKAAKESLEATEELTETNEDLNENVEKLSKVMEKILVAAEKMLKNKGGSRKRRTVKSEGLGVTDDDAAVMADIERSMGRTANSAADVSDHNKKISDYSKKYLFNLQRSVNPIKDQLHSALKSLKYQQKNIQILRAAEHLQHSYNEKTKRKLEMMKNQIALIDPNDTKANNELTAQYLLMLDEANNKVGKQSQSWRLLGNELKPLAKRTGVWLSSQVEGAYNLRAALGEPVKEMLAFNKAAAETGYSLGQQLRYIKEEAETGDIAARTGQSRVKYEKESLKMMQRGYKDQKLAASVTKTSLKMATDIGAQTEETSEFLGDWVRKYQLSESQATMLGRHMKEVAFQTGLAGSELMAAAKSAEKMSDTMRRLGKYTNEVGRNMIELSAAAKKRGVEESASAIMEATMSYENFMKDRGTANLLAVSAEKSGISGQDLMTGKVGASKDMQRQLAGGMEQFLREQITAQGGKGDLADLEDAINSMSEEGKAATNELIRGLTEGKIKGVGELHQTIESYKEATAGFTERVSDLNKQMEGNLTKEERLALEQKKQSLQFGESMKYLSEVDTLLKKGKTDEATSFLQKNQTKIAESLKEMDPASAEARLLQTLSSQAASGGLSAAGAQGFREEIAQLNADQEKREQEARSQMDVGTEAEQKMYKLAETIKSDTAVLGQILNAVGPYGALALAFAPLAAQTALSVAHLLSQLQLSRDIRAAVKGSAKATEKLEEEATKKGSLYTRDVSVVKAIENVERAIRSSDRGGGGGRGISRGGGVEATQSGHGGGKGGKRGKGKRGRGGRGWGGKLMALGGTALTVAEVASDSGILDAAMGDEGGGVGDMVMSGLDMASNVSDVGEVAGKGANMAKGASAAAKGGGAAAKGAGALSKGASVLGKAGGVLKGAMGILGKVGGPLAVITTGVSAVMQGAESMGNAAEFFGVEQEKVTTGMKAAAAAGGTVTGVFNSLTFGLFDKQLGANGTWTKGISNFFYNAGDMLSKGWEGFKGIMSKGWETIKQGAAGLWDGIKKSGALDVAKKVVEYSPIGLAWKGVKGLFGIGGGSKENTTDEMAKRATTKGSIYTHDIHLEQILQSMMGMMMAGRTTGGKTGGGGGILGGLAGGLMTGMLAPFGLAGVVPSIMKMFKMPGEIQQDQVAVGARPKVPGEDASDTKVVEKLREERAGTIGPPGAADSKNSMKATEKNTAEMLLTLQAMAAQLTRFVQTMNMSSPNQIEPTVEPGDPRAKRNPRGTANFYSWNISHYGNKPTKGPVSESSPV